jgi:hypothetical protein
MATRVTRDTLARLADVEVPRSLTENVMAEVVRERRFRPLRAVVAAASFAAWALLVHQAVQFATVRLQGLI